jgi:hypothetical protein
MIKKFEEFVKMNESNIFRRMDEIGMTIEKFLKSKLAIFILQLFFNSTI